MMPAGGGYSASGGDATSGNGDSAFDAGGNRFGGLNYNGGMSPYMMAGIGIAALIGVFLYVRR